MAALAWSVFAVLAVLWTAGAWLMAWIAGGVAEALASGSAATMAQSAAQALPQWLALWLDPVWIASTQAAMQSLVDAAAAVLPYAGAVAGWLVPLVWIAWAAGMVVLLVVAAALHVLARSVPPKTRA